MADGKYGRARSRSRTPERVVKHYYEPVKVSTLSPVRSYISPYYSPHYYTSYYPYRPYSTYLTDYTTYPYRRTRSLSPVRSDYKNYRDEVVAEKFRTLGSGHTYIERIEPREKTDFSRAYQEHFSITHSSDGQYIAVENTSLIHYIDISAWKIEHIVDGVLDAMFVFPSSGVILKPKQTIKIWGNAYRHLAYLYDFVCDTYSRFDVGYETQTVLLNQFREEVARFFRHNRSSSPRHWTDRGVYIYDSDLGYHPYPAIKEYLVDESCTGETTATVQFRIRRRGGVTFTPPVGNQYVVIENRNYSEVDISRWRIEEIVNGNYRGQFVFPAGTTLLPNEEVKASS